MSDRNEPIGKVIEVTGSASVKRADGSVEPLSLGTEIYQYDEVETFGDGAVSLEFIDDSSFNISNNARLTIDEYVFDTSTDSGSSDFSMLDGIFVYTSGQIGLGDPDDVMIATPVGSIGIRGTIIAGDIANGEITVVEGAIVLRDFGGNEVTLANQFESARFGLEGQGIEHMGVKSPDDFTESFKGLIEVSPDLFSSISDVAKELQNETSQSNEMSDEESVAVDAEAVEAAEPKTVLDEDPAERPDQNIEEAGSESDQDLEDTNDSEAPDVEDGIKPEAMKIETKASPEDALDTVKAAPAERLSQRLEVNEPDTLKEPVLRKNLSNPEQRTAELPPELLRKVELLQENLNTPEFLEGNKPLNGFGFGPKIGLETDPNKLLIIDLDALFGKNDGDERSVEYELSDETVQKLTGHSENDQIADQSTFGNSGLNLFDGDLTGGTKAPPFLIENGQLKLFINEADSYKITDGLEEIEIEVFARYEGSSSFTSGSFTLTAYDPDVSSIDNIKDGDFNVSNEALVKGSNKIYFIEDGGGNVLVGDGGLGETASDSTVFLGEGEQTATIHELSTGNTVFGTKDDDGFAIHNTDNSIDAGAGNDVITLFWDESTVRDNIEYSHIDGGAGHDILNINSSNVASLDLSAIQNADFIKNIETLDLSNGSQDTVILNVADVIGMTDQNNELFVRGEAGDKLLTQDESGNASSLEDSFVKTGNTVQHNGETYDVWTDSSSTATLFVDSDVSTAIV